MNAEIKALSRLEKAGFDESRSKSMVTGIDDLLVKSPAAFRGHFDHRFSSIDRRFTTLENSVRSSHAQINVLIGMQFALAGLLIAVPAAMLLGGR